MSGKMHVKLVLSDGQRREGTTFAQHDSHSVAGGNNVARHDGYGDHDHPRDDPDVPEPLPHGRPLLEEVRELRVVSGPPRVW